MADPNTVTTVNYLYNGDASDGILLGGSATKKVGFYGSTPVVQRASSVQAASVVSASTWASVASNQAAFNAEVAACLTGLGLWKGAA